MSKFTLKEYLNYLNELSVKEFVLNRTPKLDKGKKQLLLKQSLERANKRRRDEATRKLQKNNWGLKGFLNGKSWEKESKKDKALCQ